MRLSVVHESGWQESAFRAVLRPTPYRQGRHPRNPRFMQDLSSHFESAAASRANWDQTLIGRSRWNIQAPDFTGAGLASLVTREDPPESMT